jgi:hypothetical protein
MVTRANVARQAIDLSKATFDNLYFSLSALQRMAEEALLGTVAGSWLVPAEVEQILRECVGFIARTRGDLKDTVDRCHVLLHDLIDRTEPSGEGAAAAVEAPRVAAAVH